MLNELCTKTCNMTSVYYMYNTDQHTEYHIISNVLLHKYHEVIIYAGKVWKLTNKNQLNNIAHHYNMQQL
jgi:hypothetical protein